MRKDTGASGLFGCCAKRARQIKAADINTKLESWITEAYSWSERHNRFFFFARSFNCEKYYRYYL